MINLYGHFFSMLKNWSKKTAVVVKLGYNLVIVWFLETWLWIKEITTSATENIKLRNNPVENFSWKIQFRKENREQQKVIRWKKHNWKRGKRKGTWNWSKEFGWRWSYRLRHPRQICIMVQRRNNWTLNQQIVVKVSECVHKK